MKDRVGEAFNYFSTYNNFKNQKWDESLSQDEVFLTISSTIILKTKSGMKVRMSNKQPSFFMYNNFKNQKWDESRIILHS